MRLGLYPCKIKVGSKLYEAYGKDFIEERHRHRFEFNNEYREEYIKNGMDFGGLSPDGRLVESVEIDKNDFFVGVQYHPEAVLTEEGHTVLKNFIDICREYKERRRDEI